MSTQVKQEPMPPFNERKQRSPGLESDMLNRPQWQAPHYKAAGKLQGKKALITGGDSGIGRAVAILYAREGADIAITHLPEERRDAEETRMYVLQTGRKCCTIEGDLTREDFCYEAVRTAARELEGIDILVSNAAYQRRKQSLDEITSEEWDHTFKTNIYAYFHLARAALQFMKPGSAIIATSSETAMVAPKELVDYSATKGAIESFSKALAQMLVERGIRVNVVSPGPVWTPLNPSDGGTSVSKIRNFGSDHPMKRPAQPEEIAPAYVFLASDADSSYVSGAILAETGAKPIS